VDEKIRVDILSVIERIVEILRVKEAKDIIEVRELSNRTIHDASVFQDEDSISIAVLVYALSKIMERKGTLIDYAKLISMFEDAVIMLHESRIDSYRQIIKNVLGYISNIDSRIRAYIEEVINQAQIKKGSKIYEHGISIARASAVLGISQWELMRYIGKTGISDRFEEDLYLTKSRLEIVRRLFT